MKKKHLYVTLPLICVITVHLMMSYGNWDLNPGNWDEEWRVVSILFMMLGIVVGLFAAGQFNEDINHFK